MYINEAIREKGVLQELCSEWGMNLHVNADKDVVY